MKTDAIRIPATAQALGAAGLLPFIALAIVAHVAEEDLAALARVGLGSYALAITCFLCGAWWGIALIRRTPGLLLASNGIVVAAWLAFWLLQPAAVLWALALLLTVTVAVESRHRAFAAQSAYYRGLRLRLTAVATACLAAAALA